MKRNAIVRIIIYSIIIALLSIVLLANLGHWLFVRKVSNGRKITVMEPITGSGFVSQSEQILDDGIMTGYLFDAATIDKLDIDWYAGNITISRQQVPEIQITEFCPAENHALLVLSESSNGTLKIKYDSKDTHLPSLTAKHGKDLIINVPLNWECQKLTVNAASADIEVNSLLIQEAELNTASSDCRFDDCHVGELEVNAASGNVVFNGTLKEFENDSASGSADLQLYNIPEKIEMDSVSGDLNLRLPSDCGFTIKKDALSMKLDCDFPIDNSVDRNVIVCGDGHCQISLSGLSGKVAIHNSGTPSCNWGEHHADSEHHSEHH